MTEKLFLEDAALRECTARIVEHRPAGIVLDRTVFYARSGGQPGDTGTMRWPGGEAAIGEALKGEDGVVVHPIEGEAPPVGAEVTVALDWARRHRHMRMHTTMHLLCSLTPGIGVTGGQIGAEKSRLDFNLPEPPPKEWWQERLNALVAEDHPVSFSSISEAELDANPGLVRTLSVQPPRSGGQVRLVRIGDEEKPVDLQPCGGTHVARTGEIGRVTVLKLESKGRQNRRISIGLED
ncbi:alanyl-tRNA editing protein [Sabulicella glaciei]|uniref:Alanine--tRNA ligase n=1 Tax=Sabulicella glaciei TaxID=2984948 RepID=A0ABT3NWB0_9PROT|nr:alanyl-tRNA editing protein [Roseococcus sp. MDT2-1-1]MCW8086459.1 alanyl-tRNA editing protein [Roseococcus sp. MDT2-1-1]